MLDTSTVPSSPFTGADLVIVNLYAFEATVAKGADFDTCIENVDIGGAYDGGIA